MISVFIDAKIKSQDDWLPVDGNANAESLRLQNGKVSLALFLTRFCQMNLRLRKPFWARWN